MTRGPRDAAALRGRAIASRCTVAHCIFTDWQSMMCNDAFERGSTSAHWRRTTMAMSLVEAAAATIIAFAILASIVH
jgi:hypothetical protein